VILAEVYSFREDWHQGVCARPLIRQYQAALDAALKREPSLQGCAVACCHCGIRFLTHPRNARREDLRCPFGCRQHHRRERANERSRLYSQSDSAKRKKKRLNGKRSRCGCETPIAVARDDCGLLASAEQPAIAELVNATRAGGGGELGCELNQVGAEPAHELLPADGTLESLSEKETAADVGSLLEGFVLDEATLVSSSVLPYARMVASLILRRTISPAELLARLRRRLRQHSIGRLSRREYVLRYLNEHPP
jgi:hypothetical protein